MCVSLERALRNFSCLTKGDTIAIQHGNENFYLDVKEVRPAEAISIIETDVNVDFEAALDAPAYEPASRPTPAAAASASSSSSSSSSFQEPSYSSSSSSNLTAPAGVTAAERDFSTGGWGSSGQDDPTGDASQPAAPDAAGSGSDYFAKLGTGNKLVGKRKATAPTSAQPSPSPSPTMGPTAIAQSSSMNGLAALRSGGGAPARPQSALAGRAGGYSLTGGSTSSSSASTASSSSSSAAPSLSRPTSAAPSSSSSGGLAPGVGKTIVIERQGAWSYHYEVDGKGGKRLIRRLPAKDETKTNTPTTAAASATPAGGLAALGPGHRLK